MRAPPIRRTSTRLAAALALLLAACTDRPTAPLVEPVPPPGSAALQCTADVRGGSLSCAPAEGGARLSASGEGWIFGGQGQLVRLASGNVNYDAATGVFRADVTVTNLLPDPIGTPDGGTVGGVRVFFHSAPVATAGSGVVEVENADGVDVFTGSGQPFFLYDQIVQPGGTSAPKTWRWSVPSTVESFAFTLYVQSPRFSTPGPGEFTLVSVNWSHSCGVLADGRAFCWGNNGHGRLGHGGESSFAEPVPVAGGLSFRTVTAGLQHTCGVTTSDQAYCWGDNLVRAVGAPPAVIVDNFQHYEYNPAPTAVTGGIAFAQLDAGSGSTCGVDKQGGGWCWGDNEFAQGGTGAASRRLDVPTAVAGGKTWKMITTGDGHACGVTTGGELYCWGNNRRGQLGAPSSNTCVVHIDVNVTSSYPCSLTMLELEGTWSAVDAGTLATCALDAEGRAYCWGDAAFGLGTGTSGVADHVIHTPTAVQGGLRFATISVGYGDVCGLTTDGAAACWGAVPTGLDGGAYRWIAAGQVPQNDAYNRRDGHRCGVLADGTAVCMGFEQYGELGDGGEPRGGHVDPRPVAALRLRDDPPGASFYFRCTDRTCRYEGRQSTDDYGVVQYLWDFGDGTTGTGPAPEHTYAAAGTYTIRLTVVDRVGQRSTSAPETVTLPCSLCP